MRERFYTHMEGITGFVEGHSGTGSICALLHPYERVSVVDFEQRGSGNWNGQRLLH